MLKYLIIFWFVREIKAVLFWLYLWQLKEYRLDRLFSHLKTTAGKRIIIKTRERLAESPRYEFNQIFPLALLTT